MNLQNLFAIENYYSVPCIEMENFYSYSQEEYKVSPFVISLEEPIHCVFTDRRIFFYYGDIQRAILDVVSTSNKGFENINL